MKTKNNKKINCKKETENVLSNDMVKVGWEELLYDLIFIIVISKMSEAIVATSLDSVDYKFIISEFILYFTVILMWFSKVMNANRLHILEQKLNIKISKYKYITYVQMTILIVLFSQLKHSVTINYYIYLLIIAVSFSILTSIALRNYLVKYYSEDKKELFKAFLIYKNLTRRDKFEVNLAHLLERIGILMILFLGEILSCIFSGVDNMTVLLFSVIILLNTFSSNIRIIEVSEEKKDPKILKSTIHYFVKNFILYLILIICLEYSSHHDIGLPYIFTGIIIINKLYQRWTLLKLKDISLNKVELLSLMYFITMVIIVFSLGIVNVYIFILVILIGVVEKLRNEYYKVQKSNK